MAVGSPACRSRAAILPRHGFPRGLLSGRIPDRTVREIVEQTDMNAVVGEVVELRRAGSSWKGLCPFHNEKSPSFHVNPGRKIYHCFGCGVTGDAIRFVRETRGLTFVEAVEHLADRLGIRIEREQLSLAQQQKQDAERSARGRMLDLARCAQDFFRGRFDRPEGQGAREYAIGRGLGAEIIERFGLGAASTGWTDLIQHLQRHRFADDEIAAMGLGVPRARNAESSAASESNRNSGGMYDRFRDRLMYPIHNAAGDIVGFGGRHLASAGDDREVAKYMNSPETTLPGEGEDSRFYHFYKKGQVVFGLWQARQGIRRTKMAVVVEGNIDVMTLHQAGIDNAVCAMGTALTEQQTSEIKRFTERVALVFDGDKAGRKAAMKAVPVCLHAGLDGVYVLLPEGEDPDSYVRKNGAEAFEKLLKSAPHMLNGYIDALVAESDGSVQARALVLQQAGPLLSSVQDPIARDMARDYLAARLLERGELSENRRTLEGYLGRMVPPKAAPQAAPLPDPTFGEPELEELEQQFAAVLVWYPALVSVAERAGGIDHVAHDGMRQALRDLCAHARLHELDGDAITGWAQTLADGRARRCILRWLIEPPQVTPQRAEAWLEQTLARLHERWLRNEAARIQRELAVPGLAFDRVLQLAEQKQQVARDIHACRKSLEAHMH